MDKKDFKVGDVWLTRNGTHVTIIKTDLKSIHPIVGYFIAYPDNEVVRDWTIEGFYSYHSHEESEFDIVRKYVPVYTGEIWINSRGEIIIQRGSLVDETNLIARGCRKIRVRELLPGEE